MEGWRILEKVHENGTIVILSRSAKKIRFRGNRLTAQIKKLIAQNTQGFLDAVEEEFGQYDDLLRDD